jgi:arylformamidase
MGIYDVTVTLRDGMPIYPGNEGFHKVIVSKIADGGSSNLSVLRMGAHSGTHVDALCHMIDGRSTVDQIPPSVLVGPATVVAIRDEQRITRAELEKQNWDDVQRALFKTANSGKIERLDRFVEDFVYMHGDAAQFLASKKLLLVGVDYISVDRLHSGTHPAHLALMGAGIVIVEGLDLRAVEPGNYEMFCGPLKIKGGDGAPARVFLRQA